MTEENKRIGRPPKDTKEKSIQVTIYVPLNKLLDIDKLVASGKYSSRSEFYNLGADKEMGRG